MLSLRCFRNPSTERDISRSHFTIPGVESEGQFRDLAVYRRPYRGQSQSSVERQTGSSFCKTDHSSCNVLSILVGQQDCRIFSINSSVASCDRLQARRLLIRKLGSGFFDHRRPKDYTMHHLMLNQEIPKIRLLWHSTPSRFRTPMQFFALRVVLSFRSCVRWICHRSTRIVPRLPKSISLKCNICNDRGRGGSVRRHHSRRDSRWRHIRLRLTADRMMRAAQPDYAAADNISIQTPMGFLQPTRRLPVKA